jgi:hypothetical protein
MEYFHFAHCGNSRCHGDSLAQIYSRPRTRGIAFESSMFFNAATSENNAKIIQKKALKCNSCSDFTPCQEVSKRVLCARNRMPSTGSFSHHPWKQKRSLCKSDLQQHSWKGKSNGSRWTLSHTRRHILFHAMVQMCRLHHSHQHGDSFSLYVAQSFLLVADDGGSVYSK